MRFIGHAFVDWDDTIAENIRYFNQSEEANTALIARQTGAAPEVVRRRGQELDLATAKRVGLIQESLAIAWVDCYHEFCRAAGQNPDQETEAAVRRACAMPYEVRQELLPGAASLLQWLFESEFEVTVWTAGDEAVQRRKVRNSGLEGFVHRLEVVADKTPERLAQALGARDYRHSFVVGNSIRSDIRPALSVGIAAYHVPAETWAYDHGRLDLSDPNYEQIDAISDLPELLAERFGLESLKTGDSTGA